MMNNKQVESYNRIKVVLVGQGKTSRWLAEKIVKQDTSSIDAPAKKTKIYAYLETLLGKSRSQKKLIKDANRNYENTEHWNLDAKYLEPLKEFMEKVLEK